MRKIVIDEITLEIDIRARKLPDSGEISELYENEPFETRLAKISQETAKLAVSIWGGILHGSAIFYLITNPKLLDIAESFCGEELIASSVYRLRPKIPNFGYGEVPVHQDSGYFEPFCDDSLVLTMWIPLVDTNPDNGCLYVIPASHKGTVVKHEATEDIGAGVPSACYPPDPDFLVRSKKRKNEVLKSEAGFMKLRETITGKTVTNRFGVHWKEMQVDEIK